LVKKVKFPKLVENPAFLSPWYCSHYKKVNNNLLFLLLKVQNDVFEDCKTFQSLAKFLNPSISNIITITRNNKCTVSCEFIYEKSRVIFCKEARLFKLCPRISIPLFETKHSLLINKRRTLFVNSHSKLSLRLCKSDRFSKAWQSSCVPPS